jgi:hypothetical protein
MAYKTPVKPTILVFSITFAAAFVIQAQTNSSPPASAPTNESQPSSAPAIPTHPSDAEEIIQARLKKIEVDAPVNYRTNGNLVFCTVRCRDLDQRNAVYDGFSSLQKYGLTATKNPPTVTVVLLLDAAKYLTDQQNQKLVAKLQNAATNLVGHVLLKTPDGLLVTVADSEVVLVTDAPNLSDGDAIKVTAFRVGTYEITDKSGSRRVLRKYTCDVATATDHWTPVAASEAKAETQKRTELSE